MDDEAPPTDSAALLEFLYRLGQAYIACGEQTAQVELLLRRTASALGVRGSRVVVFPTAIFISVQQGTEERVTLAEGPTQTLRLDQIADVYALGEAARDGALTPQDGVARLAEIQRKKPRFGVAGAVLGHAVLTVGLALVLTPALPNLAVAAFLGVVVGLLKVLYRDQPILSVPLPVIAATLVSALVYLGVKLQLPVHPQYALVPALVTFLPGSMLTLGMVELAYGHMVSGSGRLVTGFVQLVLLAFGLAAGAALVGVSTTSLLEPSAPLDQTPWVAWVGVAVFGVGVFLHFSAPEHSLLWLLVVLYLAYAAQQLAAVLFGNEISGFFGTLVATPLGYLIQLRFRGPPAMVTFLPTFWLLVPGSLGLLSVTRMLSDRAAGLEGLSTAIFVFASIALGALMGASLYKWLTERFGWWRLQIGRVGRYFRHHGGKK